MSTTKRPMNAPSSGRRTAPQPSRAARRWLTGLLFGVAAAGCGNLTMGGFGEAVVVVSGDSPDSVVAAPAAVVGGPSFARVSDAGKAPARADGEEHPEGQLEATIRLYVVSQAGAAVPLSDDEVEIRLDLGGVEQDETLPQQIPADVYTDLRIVFLEIEVQVDAGLVIGGDTITGPIDIEMETDSLVVDRPLALDIADQERAEIFVDLNAASWLQAVDPLTLSVDANDFAGLIAVVVR
jgi:hypothetical protein